MSVRPIRDEGLDQRRNTDPVFANWLKHNVRPHRVPGYSTVVVSLKEPGRTPGDASSDAMDLVADLAERFSRSEARVNYTQNLMLPHVATSDVTALYDILAEHGLATGNYDLLGDMICCPGSTIAISPMPARSRSPRRSPSASRTRSARS